jgi:cereblon
MTDAADHLYLFSEDSQCADVTGRTFLEEGAEIELPILALQGVVLFPNETLPLRFFRLEQVRLLRQMHARALTHNHVGIVNVGGGRQRTSACTVGTTAELVRILNDEAGAPQPATIAAMLKGRQRFQILKLSRRDGIMWGKARVLCELDGIPMPPAAATGGAWWSSWVYKMYDSASLAVHVRQALLEYEQWATISSESSATSTQSNGDDEQKRSFVMGMPSDANPQVFSNWVAAALPLDDAQRQTLLEEDSTVARLRTLLELLRKWHDPCVDSTLHCSHCMSRIARRQDVFCLSSEGCVSSFVNPAGYVHQTVTLRSAGGMLLQVSV